MPNSTIDPIVIAARTVVALQTIVSREVKPGEVAVVTVGYIQAGTKNNIIPDQAELGLTVRSYKPEVRKQVLAAIERITKAEADAAGARANPRSSTTRPRMPSITIQPWPSGCRACWSRRSEKTTLLSKTREWLRRISLSSPRKACRPSTSAWEERIRRSLPRRKQRERHLPSNHSSLFAPDVDPDAAYRNRGGSGGAAEPAEVH